MPQNKYFKTFVKNAIGNVALDALGSSFGVNGAGIFGGAVVAGSGEVVYEFIQKELKEASNPKSFKEFIEYDSKPLFETV